MEFKAGIAELNSLKVERKTAAITSSSSNNNNNNNNNKCGTDNCPVHFHCDDDQLFNDYPCMKTESADDFTAVRVKTEPTCDSSFFADDGGKFNDCDTCVECFEHNRSREPSEVSRQLEQTSTATSESISSANQARPHAAETSRGEPKCTKIPEESGTVAVDNGNDMTSIHNTPIGVSHLETTNIEQDIDTDVAPEDHTKTPSVSAKRYECQDCLKRFSSKSHLTRHAKRTHGGEKLYKFKNTENSFKDPIINATKLAINPAVEQSDRQRHGRKFEASKNTKSNKFQHYNTTLHNSHAADSLKVFKQAANVQDGAPLNSIRNTYGCPHCTKKFKSSNQAKRHLMQHTGEKPYLCRKCEKKFRGYAGLKVHMMSHTDERPYKCPHCGKLFRQLQYMKSHLHWRSGEKPHTCPHCDKQFETFNKSRNHVLKVHPIDGPNSPCPYCRQIFAKARSMKTNKQLHKCPQCEKTFSSSGNVKRHIVVHTSEKSLPRQCSKILKQKSNLQNSHGCLHCSKKFTSSNHAKRHLMLHTREKPYICRMCEKKFRVHYALKLHMLSHTGERPFKCPHCEMSFRQSQHLKSHLHRRSGEKPHTCPHCDKEFSTLNESRNHVITVHPIDGPNSPCSYCKQIFAKTRSMKRNKQLHKCPQCEKTFASSRNVKRHIVVHTTEKSLPRPCSDVLKQNANLQNSHECLHCSKKFTSSSHAKRHLMLHTREKPYRCRICEKTFRGYNGLKVHMMSHTDEMPYKCPHCEKLFRQSQHLKSHLHWRSGEKPHTCPHCENEFATFTDSMNHVITVHPIDGPNSPCPYCRQIFGKARSMKTNKQLHKCPQCEKTFASSRNVKRHIMMHSGEKPLPPKDENTYPCPQCGKKFRLSRYVRRHLTTCMHSGVKPYDMMLLSVEKPYKCPKCDHLFRQLKHLKSHLLHLHSDKKPHGCPHCEKKFKHQVM